jgi:hypothetical protein
MEIITKLSRFIGVALLGVVYVKLLTFSMSQLHNVTGDLFTDFAKISFVTTSVVISCTIVFLFNKYILKGNKKHLGYWCALFAFIYFYIVKTEGEVLLTLVTLFFYLYSAMAFLLFIFTPIIIGNEILQRITRRLFGATQKTLRPHS